MATVRERYHNFLSTKFQLTQAEIRTEMSFYDMLQDQHDEEYLTKAFDRIDGGWGGTRYFRAFSYIVVYIIMMFCFSAVGILGCLVISDKCTAGLMETTSYCTNKTGVYQIINSTCMAYNNISYDITSRDIHCLNTTSHTIIQGSLYIPFTEGYCGYTLVGAIGSTTIGFIIAYVVALVYTHHESEIVTKRTQLIYLGEYFER